MSKIHEVAAKTGKKLTAASTAQLAEMAQILNKRREAQRASAAVPQTGSAVQALSSMPAMVSQQFRQSPELRQQVVAAQPRTFADFNSAQELYNFRLQNTRENADGNAVSEAIQADIDALDRRRKELEREQWYHTADEMERINAQYSPEEAVYSPEQIALAREYESLPDYANQLDAFYTQRIGEEEDARRNKRIQSYENVRSDADYSQRVALGKASEAENWDAYYNKRRSQEHGRGAQEFSSVNRKSYAKDYTKQLANPAEWAAANAEFLLEVDIKGDIETGETTADYGLSEPLYLYMTPEQRDVYSYYVATGGRKKADEYFDSIKKDLREVRNEARSAYQQEWAAEEPVAAFVARTINQLGTLGNIPETIKQEFQNSEWFGDGIDRPLDTSVAAFDASRRSEAYSQGITSNVDSEFGRFMLNVGFSLSDNAVAMGAGLILGPAASAALLSAESGSAALYEAGERGLSPSDASKLAVVTGGWEYLTEKIAFDELFDLVKVAPQSMTAQKVLNILKQSGVEASEEYANSLLSTMTERAVLGGNSAYDQYVRDMQMQDASYEEAVDAANLQFYWLQPLESAAAGFVSGGVMGAGGTAVSDMMSYGTAGEYTRNEVADSLSMTQKERATADRLVEISRKEKSGGSTVADNVAYKILTGQAPSNSEIRRLKNATTTIQRSFEAMTGIEVVGVDSTNLRASIRVAARKSDISPEVAKEYENAVTGNRAKSVHLEDNEQSISMRQRITLLDAEKRHATQGKRMVKLSDSGKERIVFNAVDMDRFTRGNVILERQYKKVTKLLDVLKIRSAWYVGNVSSVSAGMATTLPHAHGMYAGDVVLLNAAAVDQAYDFTLGHELWHYIAKRNPVVIDQLYSLYRSQMEKREKVSEFDDALQTIASKYGWNLGDKATELKAFEEYLADRFGAILSDDQFVERIVAEKPTVWQRICAAIRDFIELLKREGVRDRRVIEDIDAYMLQLTEEYTGTYIADLRTRVAAAKVKRRFEGAGSVERVGDLVADHRFDGGAIAKSIMRHYKGSNQLIAQHSIHPRNLSAAFKLGTLVAPSIAVTTPGSARGYGPISLVFDKSSIDPAIDENTLYDQDGWTPDFREVERQFVISGNYNYTAEDALKVIKELPEHASTSTMKVTMAGTPGDHAYTPRRVYSLQEAREMAARLWGRHYIERGVNQLSERRQQLRDKVLELITADLTRLDKENHVRRRDDAEYETERKANQILEKLESGGRFSLKGWMRGADPNAVSKAVQRIRKSTRADVQQIGEISQEIARREETMTTIDASTEDFRVRRNALGFGNDQGNRFIENYFESKPKRLVGFEEVRYAVVPESIDEDLMQKLIDFGIDVRKYGRKTGRTRTEILNSLDDIKFSLSS